MEELVSAEYKRFDQRRKKEEVALADFQDEEDLKQLEQEIVARKNK